MVTFRSIGGLGNQLFVVAAALAHSQVFRTPVQIDDRRRALGRESGGPHSMESSLHSLWIKGLSTPSYGLSRVLNASMDYGASAFERFLPREFSKLNKLTYTSKTTGYDNAVFDQRAIYFRGYFQSYRYLDYLWRMDSSWDIRLRAESEDFISASRNLEKERFTVIHIRRGDYKNLKNEFGLLSSGYYSNALRRLQSEGLLYPVKVFSDDTEIKQNKEFQAFFEDYDCTFVDTKTFEPAETLMLMSQGSSFAIANSSFSWWAASLSRSSNVIFPLTWFRSGPQPLDLAFPFWTPIESAWTDT